MNEARGRRSSLISRFAASTAVLGAVVVVLSVVFFFFIHRETFAGAVQFTLRGYSSILAEVIWEKPDVAQEIARRHRVGIAVATPEGRIAFSPDGQPTELETLESVERSFQRIDLTGPGGQQVAFYWDMVAFARGHTPQLVVMIILLLVLIGVTYAFQLAQLRPLSWLRSGVEAVSRGDFSARVPVARDDEIGQVARAFNQMTRRVERMLRDRERLLGDVSHELRSPLARIKVALELLPAGDKRDAIARDVYEMEALTAALLERERASAADDDAQPVDLAAIVREVAGSFDGRPPGFEIDAPANVTVRGDAARLRVLVHNLIDNAVKFSLPDSRPVEVRLRAAGETLALFVTDDGRGIPNADVARVFEPFVKLDPARGHRVGYGLGLDICKRIVAAHGGTIMIAPRDERGTRVTVSLPCE